MTVQNALRLPALILALLPLAIALPCHADASNLITSSALSVVMQPLHPAGITPSPSQVPGQVLIRYNNALSAQNQQPVIAAMASRVEPMGHSGYSLIRLKPGLDSVASAMATLRALPGVAAVQPNYIYHATALTNDPQIGQQWALKNTGQTIANASYSTNNPGIPNDDIGIEAAWQHQSDCSAVTVAVIDEGINYTQQDLAANMWNGGSAYPYHGYDFIDNDNNPYPNTGDEQHGTHVAGIIGAAGNNGIEGSGVCQKASLMAVRALSTTGGTTATVTQGINFAVDHGAKVINLSLGGGGTLDPAFSDAITYAQSKGVIVVVAAGNGATDNDQTPTYPCNFTQKNLICVAAVDQAFQLASFSNFGATSVDVGAPGSNILSTLAGASQTTDFVNWNKTSTTQTGWAARSTTTGIPVLVDPSDYGNGNYAANTDDRAWHSFTFGANTQHVALNYILQGSIASGDFVNSAVAAVNQDPFTAGSALQTSTGTLASPTVPYNLDANCANNQTCSVGFQLKTAASSPGGTGPLVAELSLDTIQNASSVMGNLNGTSMAAPIVSGIAALLMASQPAASNDRVIQAIETSGTPVPSLTGVTTSGKVVSAIRALAQINLGISGLNNPNLTVEQTPAIPSTPSGLNNLNLTVGQTQAISFTLSGLDSLAITVFSNNQAVLPDAAITGQTACTMAGTCTLQLRPTAAGTASVTLALQDNYGQQTSRSFSVNVVASITPTPSGGGGGMNLWFLILLGAGMTLTSRLSAKRKAGLNP
ncbi:MAG: S8 family serine peptidase [Halothiobacillus sp.]